MIRNRSCSHRAAATLAALITVVALAETEESIHKNLNTGPEGTLVVDVNFGSIEVKTNAGPEVTVDVWRKVTRSKKAQEEEYLREHPVTIDSQNGTVTVSDKGKPENNFGWKNRNEGRYTISIPAQFKADLRTSGGGINVAGLRADLKAQTSGGHLKFSDLVGNLDGHTSGGGINADLCRGRIHVGTSGGHIEVTKSSGTLKGETSGGHVKVLAFDGPVAVGTSGGHITLEDVTGAVDASTSGGSVRASMIAMPEHIRLSTSGGHVTVVVPEKAAFELNAQTSAGRVSSELPVTMVGKLERDRLMGTVNGGGPLVHLRTSGGNVEVKKK